MFVGIRQGFRLKASDLVFALVLGSVLVGGRFRLLNDPGTPWHLRLGREIVKTGSVPRVDTLSFTRGGARWVDQSWLFDLGLAKVVELGGWSAAVALAALLLAWVYGSLTRSLVAAGVVPFVAVVVGVLAAGIGSIHFLVRPHLFTIAFFWITLELCRRQHERGGWIAASVIPLTAVWANLHGGFLAAPVVVLVAAAGHAVSGPFDADRRRNVNRFLLVATGCVCAAALNPYGFGLYVHVAGLLVSSGVTELIEEYQPVPFGKADARVVEWVILGLVALPTIASRRMSRYELMHALVWLHLSLASFRHVPLFALAVAPGLARMLDGLIITGRLSPDDIKEASRASSWPGLAAGVLVVAVGLGVPLGLLDAKHWPVAGLAALNERPTATRLFHEQDWGGLIEAEGRPGRLAFIDDRFELYGKPFLLEYLNALQGGPDWERLRDADAIGLVWVRPDRGLVRRLEAEGGWRVVHRDALSVLFERDGGIREILTADDADKNR